MDTVGDLVTGPFREIIEKASAAVENAGDDKNMLSESQKLVKGAERCLKIIEPLCERHLTESGGLFIDALKDNNEIADFRLELTDMLWDFDEYTEADTFDKEKYAELRELCKKAGLRMGEVLKRMKLDAAPKEDTAVPAMTTAPPTPHSHTLTAMVSHGLAHTGLLDMATPLSDAQSTFATVEAAPAVQSDEDSPPPPPTINPWDLRTIPTVDMGAEMALSEIVERRPVSSMSTPVSEYGNPERERWLSRSSSHRLESRIDRLLTEEEGYQPSPQDTRSPVSPLSPLPLRVRAPSTSTTAPIPEDQVVESGPAPFPHRYSQASSIYSQPSRQRSLESMHSSVFDVRKTDGAASPAMTENRASTTSGYDERLSLASRGPAGQLDLPSGVPESNGRAPLAVNYGEGLIPVDSEPSQRTKPASTLSTRVKDCSIGLNSSFYIYKGFCDGAQEVTKGGVGIKRIKKPGFSGAHVVAKCESCYYELDYKQIQQDVNNAGTPPSHFGFVSRLTFIPDDANYMLNKIGYRLRFLQKSHVATKRADELLFGCVFCVHSQRTLEECDATVFFTQKKLFEHLARHPRPLPQVPGVTVVEEAEVPFNLRNNYDLHFKAPPKSSPLADKERQAELAQRPKAIATQTVKRMYGMRMLSDQTPAFELANGARLAGVEFPEKYAGEWVMAWHEGLYGSAPFDVLKLEPPPRSEIKMDAASNVSAVARWRFAPKVKDGGDWLKFDQGERIANISWAWQDHWCWSGTNAKGVRGIFPQTHIDTSTIRESTDGSSIATKEGGKSRILGRFVSRKASQRMFSVGEVMVSSGPRPTVY
ncbi:hypothetical protein C8035_v007677 [Colletotrichum spinosum]|uniref:SH3 domain-containing protein n=1 Tax=Colletotrichum spinosum TaxID=1347390 RepID=A0A4R8QKS9_9PEZI|nr:hypothetical protein C8035_v007677 [Colletotrichum spinosum]